MVGAYAFRSCQRDPMPVSLRAVPGQLDKNMRTAISADSVRTEDFAAWRTLYQGYADFYGTRLTEAVAVRVWSWLHDPAHPLQGLLARGGDGEALGLAHVRPCPRPLAGTEIGFLDDLYVAPGARGSGAADALFEALAVRASECGWPAIRWLTQEFNYRGRAFYDRYTGAKTDFILYQWRLD